MIRSYQFIVGPETSTIPLPGTPTGDEDIISLGYLQSFGFTVDTIHKGVQTVANCKAITAAMRADMQLLYVDDLKKIFYFDASSSATGNDLSIIAPTAGTGRWVAVSGSGGAGGSSIAFNDEGPNSPVKEFENNMMVYMFEDALDQELYTSVKIPDTFEAGNQIKLFISTYSPSSSNTQLFKAVSTLIRHGTDAVTSTTNQYTSTNSAVSNDAANELTVHSIDLTDSVGKVNSVSVAAGNMLLIKLYRDTATDTDTGIVRMISNASEMKFSS